MLSLVLVFSTLNSLTTSSLRIRRTHRLVVITGLCSGLIAALSGAISATHTAAPQWLAGLAFAVLGGAALCQLLLALNRRMGFRQRRLTKRPVRDLLLPSVINLGLSAAGAIGLYQAWVMITGSSFDDQIAELVCLLTACVAAATEHSLQLPYEHAVRDHANRRVLLLRQATTNAQIAALKAQLDPHFLLNCVNGLCHLIRTDPAAAESFADALAWVYQYVLDKGHKDLVELREELDFVNNYMKLIQRRFGSTLAVSVHGGTPDSGNCLILPLALQTLVENAVKHNEQSAERPMMLRIRLEPRFVTVTNSLHPRLSDEPSTGLGLANLASRIRLLTGQDMRIQRNPSSFSVSIPLLRASS